MTIPKPQIRESTNLIDSLHERDNTDLPLKKHKNKGDSKTTKALSIPIVGGHKDAFVVEKQQGFLLKRACAVEKAFYENAVKKSLPITSFMPGFFGIQIDEFGTNYLKLENLTAGMQAPVIIDIKIGKHISSFSELTNNWHFTKRKAAIKVTRDRVKNSVCSSRTLHFRIVGHSKTNSSKLKIALSDPSKQFLDCLPKNVETYSDLLENLAKLHRFVLSPEFDNYELIGSSLLVVYDETPGKKNVKLALIDFAHSSQNQFPHGAKQHKKRVDDFRKGLSNLVDLMSAMAIKKI